MIQFVFWLVLIALLISLAVALCTGRMIRWLTRAMPPLVVAVALVASTPVIAAEPWQDGATVLLPKDSKGVVVTLKEKYGSPVIVDSVNIVSVYNGEVYLTRKGASYGRFALETWAVFVGTVGNIVEVRR